MQVETHRAATAAAIAERDHNKALLDKLAAEARDLRESIPAEVLSVLMAGHTDRQAVVISVASAPAREALRSTPGVTVTHTIERVTVGWFVVEKARLVTGRFRIISEVYRSVADDEIKSLLPPGLDPTKISGSLSLDISEESPTA